ncbi:acyl-[acyl-carrier-protein] thioesterase [Lentibacillus sp. Marseille-P4043]|uniref:acyl-[acyl-carrier-protein] thioesterase n=1 Tax=Lentibacillus sp. Marseille-P4043 TaxID=2040293 RepID=UPI000D0B22EF|nr:acyl-ACP thioesterase domain-containing protein [Lentibacillus sp. Marseille-P4043]
MASVSSVFKRKYHIDLRDVDFTKSLKLSTLFSYFQDIASLASEEIGFGIEKLEKEFGVAWVLTRIRVNIIRNPIWDEEITIETWPLEPGKADFDRDYLVKDENGNIIIKAVSKWVIMDLHERKIKRSKTIGIRYPENITERAIEGKLEKLKDFGTLEEVYNKVIGYSDIDFNGHLNNSKYVDYIMDCFPIDDHKSHAIHTIDLSFNHEALPGDSITLYKDISKLDENFIYIEGVNQTNDHVAFKSLVNIKQNS